MTDEGNGLKLGDFGSAVKMKAHTTVPGELKGFVGTQGNYILGDIITGKRNYLEIINQIKCSSLHGTGSFYEI